MTRPLHLLLAVSLAFNLAFAVSVGARLLGTRGGTGENGLASVHLHCNSPEVVALCSHLQCQLEALRHEQGEETRRLAELLAEHPPDRDRVESCLARLAELERGAQRLVVDTVLQQMEALPPEARATFKEYVRGRLCAPWGGCKATAPHDRPTVPREPQPDGGDD